MNHKAERIKKMHRNLLEAVYLGGRMDLSYVSSEIEWKDISNESYRTYLYPFKDKDDLFVSFAEVRIALPVLLNVNYKSGGHRIIDAYGKSHYIPSGWKHLFWESHKDGVPTFQF